MPTIGLILLAAGGSTRLGTPKQLLPYAGKTLLRRAAETAVDSACRPIQVVLGAAAEQCVLELRDLPLSTVVNEEWVEGMGSSLRLGLETLLSASPVPLDAVIVMLCDQPLLTVGTLNALAAAYATTSCPIIASQYGEVSGVPALFDRSLFPELLDLSGAQGAKQIFGHHADQTHKIAFPDGAVDIDTAADYTRLRRA
ncbi:MAG: 4-diphosphocytidyl-2C-methyl-D-erythritol synthase [Chthonomonadaceae bacterium]|nr:4-diphosphocytidyl-2C-methyl-D-erythritol synthase [Chthonomonadaceae bacterium]